MYLKVYYISDEVAIIDEIQMIGDRGRGWAWTRAVLGKIVNDNNI